MPEREKKRILSEYNFVRLVLLDGTVIEGHFRFESDGAIGAYARFVNQTGRVVFQHAVAQAMEKGWTE